MTITQDRQRFEAVKRIVRTETDPVFRECFAATLTLTYTDEQLQSYGTLPGDKMVREAVMDAYDERHDGAEVYLQRLHILAAAMGRVKLKYGDPTQPGYDEAMEAGADDILIMMNALHLKFLASDPGLHVAGITPDQAELLLAVTFLHHQSLAEDIFYPIFKNTYDKSYADWRMTRQVMDHPTTAEHHAADYSARALRRCELEGRFDQKLPHHDSMCDYSEELLGRLLTLKNNKDTHRVWIDVERHVIKRQSADVTGVSELVFFMQPFVDKLGVSYLATTIPSLHYYEELPQYEDYSKAPDEVRALCTALLRVVHAIDSLPMTHVHRLSEFGTINDPDLMLLILEHPDKAELMARVITERKTGDAMLLRSVVESHVLGEGVL